MSVIHRETKWAIGRSSLRQLSGATYSAGALNSIFFSTTPGTIASILVSKLVPNRITMVSIGLRAAVEER
jgi:hypothetical protein